MKLVICEKPSVAKAVASALGVTSRADGCFEGNGLIVSWCVGHLVSPMDAAGYDLGYKKWKYDDLPILPEPAPFAALRQRSPFPRPAPRIAMPRPSRKIAIMQAAARLFAAKGYNAVSVRDIAAEMELTPASLYYYFPDKETLYRQTLVMVFTGVQSAFKAPQGTSGIEKIECLIRNVVTYCCGNPIFTRLLLRELNEGLEERLHFLADSVFATLHENFIKILAQYGIRDTERIMESIESSLIGYLQLSRVSHSLRHYAGHPLTAAVIAERICAQIRRELQP